MASISNSSSNFINASQLEFPDQSLDTLKAEDDNGPKTLKGPQSLEELCGAHCPLREDYCSEGENEEQSQPDLTSLAATTLRMSICGHDDDTCCCVDELVTKYDEVKTSGSAMDRKDLLSKITLLYLVDKQWAKALDYLLPLLEHEKNTTGKQQGETLFNIGLCYKKLIIYKKAQMYFERALTDLKMHRGITHPLLALCFKQLGVCCFFNDALKRALDCFSSAFQIWLVHPEMECQPFELADVLHMLGHCFFELQSYDEAARYFQSELTILKSHSIPTNQPLIYAHRLRKYGECMEKLNNSSCVSLFYQSAKIVEQYYGPTRFYSYKELCFTNLVNAAYQFKQLALAREYAQKLLHCAQDHYGIHNSESRALRDAQALFDKVW